MVDFGEACTRENMWKIFEALTAATGLRKLWLSAPMLLKACNFQDHRNAIQEPAALLSKDVKLLLLCLQVSYKSQSRTWKAVDLLKFRAGGNEHYSGKVESLRMKYGAKAAEERVQKFMRREKDNAKKMNEVVRGLTNLYLKMSDQEVIADQSRPLDRLDVGVSNSSDNRQGTNGNRPKNQGRVMELKSSNRPFLAGNL